MSTPIFYEDIDRFGTGGKDGPPVMVRKCPSSLLSGISSGFSSSFCPSYSLPFQRFWVPVGTDLEGDPSPEAPGPTPQPVRDEHHFWTELKVHELNLY